MSEEALVIDLPGELRRFAEERVKQGTYSDLGAYLSHLVQRDQQAEAAARLRGLIEEGLASGPPRALSDADWAQLRQSVMRPKV